MSPFGVDLMPVLVKALGSHLCLIKNSTCVFTWGWHAVWICCSFLSGKRVFSILFFTLWGTLFPISGILLLTNSAFSVKRIILVCRPLTQITSHLRICHFFTRKILIQKLDTFIIETLCVSIQYFLNRHIIEAWTRQFVVKFFLSIIHLHLSFLNNSLNTTISLLFIPTYNYLVINHFPLLNCTWSNCCTL